MGPVLRGDGRGAASYDHLGNRYRLDAGGRDGVALDVERWDSPLSPEIVQALRAASVSEALRRWTELEVIAKLTSWPSALLLRQVAHGTELDELRPEGLTLYRADTYELCISVGLRVDGALQVLEE